MDRSLMADVARHVADGMDPALTEEERLEAIHKAHRLDSSIALAMATTFGQALIEMLDDAGSATDVVMGVLRGRIAEFRNRP